MAETYDYTTCHEANEYVFNETERQLPAEWVLLKQDDLVAVYRRGVEGSPIPEFRAVGEFEGIDPWTMNYCLRDYPFRRAFDTSLERFGCVWQGDGDHWISYNQSKPAMGGMVAARDFLDLQCARANPDGGYTHAGFHVEVARFPVQKGIVRGENDRCGWRMCPGTKPNSTRLHYILRTDLKGTMPQWLVNRAMGDMMFSFYHALRDNLPKLNRARLPPKPAEAGVASVPMEQWAVPTLDGAPVPH